MDEVTIGLEHCLEAPPARLAKGDRFGLLMNQASVDRRFRYAHSLLDQKFRGQMKALLTPQHGLWGEQQANMIESPHGFDPSRELPVFSLYSETRRPTAEMLSEFDVLVIDLQDVGCRVYTFLWTIHECLRACAAEGVPVILLDRPNPLGGRIIEGPLLEPDYTSFVGQAEIPMRHGLTLGEAARWLVQTQGIDVDLEIVPVSGWHRQELFSTSGRSWVPVSPNMPAWETCRVYCGQVLFEGTNISEGRGTTRPFEVAGAPFLEEQSLARELNRSASRVSLEGACFRPIRFTPTFDKFEGQSCGGVFLHVTDEDRFRSYTASILLMAVICEQSQEHFEWLPPPYEYEFDKMPIDILHGSPKLRDAIDSVFCSRKDSVDAVLETTQIDFVSWRNAIDSSLLYST